VILQDFFEKNSAKWKYFRKHRSIRTLKAMFDIPPIEPEGTAHNALDDCKYQAKIVRAVYQNNAPPIYLFGSTPSI
jgi:inhibitor of KinA sporulation pathway (predicted exonuclease)